MMQKLYPIFSALLIGVVGFMIGRKSISAPDSSAAKQEYASDISSSQSSSSRSEERDSKALPTKSEHHTAANLTEHLKTILIGNNPLDKAHKWLAYLDTLEAKDFEAAVSAMRDNGLVQNNMAAYQQILTAWGLKDPQAAMAYTLKIDNPFARQTVLAAWAGEDTQAALAWARTNHSGDDANPHLVAVIKGMAFQDIDTALTLLQSIPFSEIRADALDEVMPALLAQGKDTAIAWVDSLTDAKLKEGAALRLSDRLVRTDPYLAADFLLSHQDTEASRRNMDDAANNMAQKNYNDALAKFSTLPVGENRYNWFRGINNYLAQNDPQKAEAFMNSHASDVTPRAREQFIWGVHRNQPELALKQIPQITDENRKNQMYYNTLDAWLNKNPQAAANYVALNQRNLSPNVLEHFNRKYQEAEK